MLKRSLSIAIFSLVLVLPAFATDDQDRKKLIEMHEKMSKQHLIAAKCLKAGKSIQECNNEAMKGCPMMESGHCPFMGDTKSSDSTKSN